jgi:DNA-binding GntR family transcriptional regulator
MVEKHTDPNDPFPSDNELAALFGVNRLTIRKATQDLVDTGMLYRVRGIGTFVRIPKVSGELIYQKGFAAQWQLHGRKVDGQILTFKEIRAPLTVSMALQIDEETPIKYVERLRFAEQKPVILDDIYLPHLLLGRQAINLLEKSTVTSLLNENTNKIVSTALIEIEAVKAKQREVKHLKNIEVGDPLLRRKMILYSEQGEPLSYGESVHLSDPFKYRLLMPAPS